ncbi:bicaudal D-like protein 1-like isoform X3 [Chlorella sorokiniana]|uniref:Bicaudal D-like protein 1-like isoform X3 n=1 Tax=Chlorella sorokiniana TaxID=3076 RepID=A0A2P6TZ01_CHLSO|nr:bicaudal D-like protein 1-like isoform X3 [Chlorella sorokiniana]|eukprot:PRW59297.1 bicaudal D-like protein 1-like isoform X3 [Chlorella sorokiniana]
MAAARLGFCPALAAPGRLPRLEVCPRPLRKPALRRQAAAEPEPPALPPSPPPSQPQAEGQTGLPHPGPGSQKSPLLSFLNSVLLFCAVTCFALGAIPTACMSLFILGLALLVEER